MRDIPWKALAFTALVCLFGIFAWVAGFVWNILDKAFNNGYEASEDIGWNACEKLDKWKE